LTSATMKVALLILSLVAGCLSKDLYKSEHKTRIADSRAQSQVIDCYEFSNQGGNRLRAIDYISALRNYNFDNKIDSCCVTGIWLLYAEESYNSASTGSANWWVYGNNNCINVPQGFENKASSLRFTGAPDDWTASTINMYYNEYFIGDEEYSYNDVSSVLRDNAAKSVIVTGCQPWTVYDRRGYTGNCKCLYPENTSTCKPGFYSTESSLGYMARSISSARKGCYCSQASLPDNALKSGPQDLTQGGFNPGTN